MNIEMREMEIVEYSVMQRGGISDDMQYYHLGKTLVKEENGKYFDLINNEYLGIFDANYYVKGYRGLWFKKTYQDYLQQLERMRTSLKNNLVEKLFVLKEKIQNQGIMDLKVYKILSNCVSLALKKKASVILELESLKNYLAKKEGHDDLVVEITAIQGYYDFCACDILQVKINAGILANLNRFYHPFLAKKYLNLYVENNKYKVVSTKKLQISDYSLIKKI